MNADAITTSDGPGALVRRRVGGPDGLSPGHWSLADARRPGRAAWLPLASAAPAAPGAPSVSRPSAVAARSTLESAGTPALSPVARWRLDRIAPARSALRPGPAGWVARALSPTGRHPSDDPRAERPLGFIGTGRAGAARPDRRSAAVSLPGPADRARPSTGSVGTTRPAATGTADHRLSVGLREQAGHPGSAVGAPPVTSPGPIRRLVSSGAAAVSGLPAVVTGLAAGLPAAVVTLTAGRHDRTPIAPVTASTDRVVNARSLGSTDRLGPASLLRRRLGGRGPTGRFEFSPSAAPRGRTPVERGVTRWPRTGNAAADARPLDLVRFVGTGPARPAALQPGATGHRLPIAVGQLTSPARSPGLRSIGDARAIAPAGHTTTGRTATSRTTTGAGSPTTLRRAVRSDGASPSPAASPPTGADQVFAGPAATTERLSAVRVGAAGLLLRQAIPSATVVDAVASTMIRRMPPAPPRGTPRLASHREQSRGPNTPPSADPRWSFTSVAATGERSLVGTAIGGTRTRGTSAPNIPAPATSTSTTTAAADSAAPGRRPSLIDLVPPSLFDRARAGLAASTGGALQTVDQFPVRASGFGQRAATSTEVAQVTQPTDNAPAQRIAEALTPREWDELVDVVVDRLEERIKDELARRGRRFTPGVF